MSTPGDEVITHARPADYLANVERDRGGASSSAEFSTTSVTTPPRSALQNTAVARTTTHAAPYHLCVRGPNVAPTIWCILVYYSDQTCVYSEVLWSRIYYTK